LAKVANLHGPYHIPLVNDQSPEPDATEKIIRFGCGFLAGGAITFLCLIFGLSKISGPSWGIVVAGAVLFGWVAMRFGDSAWRVLSKVVSWFWH
jgi:hypothetical protein